MKNKISVAAVNYSNTLPLLHGLKNHPIIHEIELLLDYPKNLVSLLKEEKARIALLPVAAISLFPEAQIISNYGIASKGTVASVAIFSQVPMEEIETVYLDFQSYTSVRLVKILFEKYWKHSVNYLPAAADYINAIHGNTAGVIIGDRALENLSQFPYIYDLGEAWQAFTQLPFVFAAWVSLKPIDTTFIQQFDAAQAEGLKAIEEVIKENQLPYYNLRTYYTENIQYYLTDEMKQGLNLFLSWI